MTIDELMEAIARQHPVVECWYDDDRKAYRSTFGEIESAPTFLHDRPRPTMLGRDVPPPIMLFSHEWVRHHAPVDEIERGVHVLRITQGEWTYRLHGIRWRDHRSGQAILGVWPD